MILRCLLELFEVSCKRLLPACCWQAVEDQPSPATPPPPHAPRAVLFAACSAHRQLKPTIHLALDRRMPVGVVTKPGRGVPLVFSAPHTCYLERDNDIVHKPEDLTNFLADSLSDDMGASMIGWSSELVSQSVKTGQPVPDARDPNYLRDDELDSNPWNTALRSLLGRWSPWACVLVDVHGRRDHVPGMNDASVDASDCDCGLGAMRANAPPPVLRLIEQALFTRLSAAFEGTDFRLNMNPRLMGAWPDGRCTVSQQAVAQQAAAVQLELSLRLRKALHFDDRLRSRIRSALAAVARTVALAALPSLDPEALAPAPAANLGAAHDAVRRAAEEETAGASCSPAADGSCPAALLFVYAHPREVLGIPQRVRSVTLAVTPAITKASPRPRPRLRPRPPTSTPDLDPRPEPDPTTTPALPRHRHLPRPQPSSASRSAWVSARG